MKCLLSLLLSCMLFLCPLAFAEQDASFVGVWIENDGYGTLTLRVDGTAEMVYYDDTVVETTWGLTDDGYRFGEGMWYNSPMELLDKNTLSVSNGLMVFTREGILPTTDEALLLGAEPVGEEGEPFLGMWELTNLIIDEQDVDPALFGITLTMIFQDNGLVITDDGLEEPYTTLWCVSYGNAVVEGDVLILDENDQLIFDDDDAIMIFTRVLTEETDPANLADAEPVGEEGEPFFGTWSIVSLVIEDEAIDPALFGMTMTITFNADGTAVIDDGWEPYTTTWYVDGIFAIADFEIFYIDDEDQLNVDTEDGSMLFARVEEEDPAATPTEEEQLLALLQLLALMSEIEEEPAAGELLMDTKYVCTSYSTSGITLDAATLGAEYAIIFSADGTAQFTMAGILLPTLPYTIADGAYSLDYFGTPFVCTPTETGFDMDYYGTLMMHFVPAE